MQTPASLRGWGWGAEEGKSIEPKTWQLAWAIQGKHAKKKKSVMASHITQRYFLGQLVL